MSLVTKKEISENNIVNFQKWLSKDEPKVCDHNTKKNNTFNVKGHYVNISDEIKQFKAYHNLTNSSKLILFDMLSQNNKQTFRIKNSDNKYFYYKHNSECNEDISKETYERCIKQLVKNGWIQYSRKGPRGERVYWFIEDWKHIQ